MEDAPEVMRSEIRHDGWLKLRVDMLKVKGCNEVYPYDVVKIGDGVAVLAFVDQETVLLEAQYRHPIQDRIIELVQGGIKENESPEEAALRELIEETGYEGVVKRMITICPLPGSLDMRLHIMRATGLRKKQEPNIHPLETSKLIFKPYEEVVREVLSGSGKHLDSALVIAVLYNEAKYRQS